MKTTTVDQALALIGQERLDILIETEGGEYIAAYVLAAEVLAAEVRKQRKTIAAAKEALLILLDDSNRRMSGFLRSIEEQFAAIEKAKAVIELLDEPLPKDGKNNDLS